MAAPAALRYEMRDGAVLSRVRGDAAPDGDWVRAWWCTPEHCARQPDAAACPCGRDSARDAPRTRIKITERRAPVVTTSTRPGRVWNQIRTNPGRVWSDPRIGHDPGDEDSRAWWSCWGPT